MRENDIKEFLVRVLSRVKKPGRYIGGEVNAANGPKSSEDLRFALAFPEVYEIGMSHLGLSILYSILDNSDGVSVERVFAPWPDMEGEMKRQDVELFTLETKTPLMAFDIIGFSLMYELTFTNVITMLSLSRIPLLSSERVSSGDKYPLIIAGGASTFNPEPIAEIFDAIVIGDGEEVILEIVETVRRFRGGKKEELLNALDMIEGIYVPGFFEPEYSNEKFSGMRYRGGGKKTIRKGAVKDLNSVPGTDTPIIPIIGAVHDRISVEIARGCVRGCRFCQAGYICRPMRERDMDKIVSQALTAASVTGFEEVSLLSLSTGDYSRIVPLMRCLMGELEGKGVALSVPSLRVDTLSTEIIDEIKRVRKTGFTIAPEAGSQRLRDVINKNITDDGIEKTIDTVFQAGWRLIKLYFMIGLPTETDDDIRELIGMVKRLEGRIRGHKRGGMNVAISTFVPKPHTPFQWGGFIGLEGTKRRQRELREGLSGRRIKLKFHSPEMSYLEAVFSRGDRRLLATILKAHELGSRFDGWTEGFDFTIWEEAFNQCGLDMEAYADGRHFGTDDPQDPHSPLPWGHIDTGVKVEYLKDELNKAMAGTTTPDCIRDRCQGCGVCMGNTENVIAKGEEGMGNENRSFTELIGDNIPDDTPQGHAINDFAGRLKYLFFYSRDDNTRFLSHLETAAAITRAITMAGLPVNYSQGFHPKPRMSFAGALPVGVKCIGEPFSVELSDRIDIVRAEKDINSNLPRGLMVVDILELGDQKMADIEGISRPTYTIFIDKGSLLPEDVVSRSKDFLKKGEAWIEFEKKGKSKRLDLRPFVEDIEIAGVSYDVSGNEGCKVTLMMKQIGGTHPGPYRVISSIFGISDGEARSLRVVKEALFQALIQK